MESLEEEDDERSVVFTLFNLNEITQNILDSRSNSRHTSPTVSALKILKKFTKMHTPPFGKTRLSSRRKRRKIGKRRRSSTRSPVLHTSSAKLPSRPRSKHSRQVGMLWRLRTTTTTTTSRWVYFAVDSLCFVYVQKTHSGYIYAYAPMVASIQWLISQSSSDTSSNNTGGKHDIIARIVSFRWSV
jgi:hypothetical protein